MTQSSLEGTNLKNNFSKCGRFCSFPSNCLKSNDAADKEETVLISAGLVYYPRCSALKTTKEGEKGEISLCKLIVIRLFGLDKRQLTDAFTMSGSTPSEPDNKFMSSLYLK